MTDETLARIEAGVQTEGVGFLCELAGRDPALFLELIGYVLGEEEVNVQDLPDRCREFRIHAAARLR